MTKGMRYIEVRRNRHYDESLGFRMPKIQKSLKWLERYMIALHKSGVADVNKIYAIRAFKLPITKREQTLAQCVRLGNNKHYVITLRLATHKQEEKKVQLKTTAKTIVKNIGHQRIPVREILSDAAHEVAHILDNFGDGHTVDHEMFTTVVYLIFLKQLRKDIEQGLFTPREA